MEFSTLQVVFLMVGAVLVAAVAYKLARRDAAALERAITEAVVVLPLAAFLFWLDKEQTDWRVFAGGTLLMARFVGSFAGDMAYRSSERRKVKAAESGSPAKSAPGV